MEGKENKQKIIGNIEHLERTNLMVGWREKRNRKRKEEWRGKMIRREGGKKTPSLDWSSKYAYNSLVRDKEKLFNSIKTYLMLGFLGTEEPTSLVD